MEAALESNMSGGATRGVVHTMRTSGLSVIFPSPVELDERDAGDAEAADAKAVGGRAEKGGNRSRRPARSGGSSRHSKAEKLGRAQPKLRRVLAMRSRRRPSATS